MSDEEKTIHLEQFLKLQGISGTGGNAKMLIQSGEVRVNRVVETRRKRQLVSGDKVQVGAETFVVSDLK
ncbi:MAG: RNA-binding S4 domain-containing protein [Planctomycetaceae bacterium]|nr:RNA-binding S4 domain-containing protein [Planctomycetaceae bacterium]MBN8602877.1 RNA-binding S4 domain-containing protein [Planctomycetota bacterium]